MPESPIKGLDGVINFDIYSEGEAIKVIFGLISFKIRKEVNRIGKAVFVFEAGDMSKGEVEESDHEAFAPGKNIRIDAGYGDTSSTIFEGLVVSHNLSLQGNNECRLEIECRDYAFAATQVRRNRLFKKKKDSAAMTEILGAYPGLGVSIDTTTTEYGELTQYYCSDWDFVLSRADANGLIVITEGKEIRIKKPKVKGTPDLKVTYGTDIIEFKGELNAADQMGTIKAQAWNCKTQKLMTVEGNSPELNEQGNITSAALAEAVVGEEHLIQTAACLNESELQSLADAQLLKAGMSRILGTCKFCGNAKALPGKLLELEGLGARFDGHVFIGSVEHELDETGWTTTVGMGISPKSTTERTNVVAPPAAGLIPGIQGLYIGKVTKLDEDPSGEHMIQVKIPLLGNLCDAIWARMGNFWASSSYGSFFIPDIDDEVILGFFNNDPRHPVILGSLYSSKQAPPYPIAAENKTRALMTKSKMKIEFDEEKKVVTIETPGKNKVELSDDAKSIKLTDQHSNKIEMTESGILINSAKAIILKAATDIVLDAGSNMDQQAKSNVTIKGLNIEAKANAGFTAKGTATAELSASGQTTVKGAMVMIN